MTAQISTEVLIIGSGVAGAMCAYALAQKGIKVTILEAGPRIKRDEVVTGFKQSPYLDLSAGYPNAVWAPRPDWGQGQDRYIEKTGPDILTLEYLRVVGGTTWHWAGIAIRPHPNDFKLRNLYGVGDDWPISYQDLEPYYVQAEYEMGVAGDSSINDGSPRSKRYPLPPIPPTYVENLITKTLNTIAITFISRPSARNSLPFDNRVQCQGYNTCSPICPTGAQYSAMVHVNKAEALGVQVIENTRVDRLETDKSGHISAVHFGRPDGSKGVAEGRLIVIAANGIETPRLLLMSRNEQCPDGLANHSGVVGRYFMDHPGLRCEMILPQPVYAGRGPVSTTISFTFRDGSFRSERAAWTLSVNNRVNIQDTANNALRDGLLPPELDKTIRNRAFHEGEIDTLMETLPNRDNRITLDWSKRDSAGQPGMRIYFSYGDYEKAGFEFSREIFLKSAKALNALDTKISEPYSHHHLMGMTRMGNDPETSVVDSDCRSHEHPNLFIASSSVFPTGTTANPTLTIAALSLRLADYIKSAIQSENL